MTHDVLENKRDRGNDAFTIPYYKELKTYLIIVGQSPNQTDLMNKINVTFMVGSCISVIIPTLLCIYVSICENNLTGVIECLPHLITAIISILKLLSLHINRKDLRSIFISVKNEWELLESSGNVHILDQITRTGSKLARLYRNTLLLFLVIFVMLPLCNPILDIIVPLNETRPRGQIFKVYYLVNNDDHFYPIYLHLSWCAFASVIIIVTVDSLYMVITHHACGLFAVCGYKIKTVTEHNAATNVHTAEDVAYEEVKECVTAHTKAIEFCELLDEINRKNFLLQVGLNMIGISVTAFQIAMHMNEPDETIRYAIFFSAQNFHLFYISLPGQMITDWSIAIANSVYSSEWFQTPMRIQKVLLMIQMRSGKPCEFTAGGLYKMNTENSGATFKTCMSYFTMLLSMKE